MIIFNKQFFLYSVFIVSLAPTSFACASDLPELDSYVPIDFITPQCENRKRARSSVEKQVQTDSYKQKKDHENNQESAEKIENFIYSKERLNSISTPEMKSFDRDVNRLKETPEGTRNRVGLFGVTRALNDMCFDEKNISSVEKNKKILSQMQSDSAESKFASKFADLIYSPEARLRGVVNTDHVMIPSCSYDDDNRLKAISGGHALECYFTKNLLGEDETVFVGSDDRTLGVSISGKISKTLQSDMTELSIIDDLHEGITIAKSHNDKRFKVAKLKDNRYVGSYQDPHNLLHYLTQFPLLVVTNKLVDKNNKILVGTFAQLKNDGTVDKRFTHQKELTISVQDFNNFMERGKKFIPCKEIIAFVEITEQLNEHFKKDLHKLGRDSFPAPIYGIHESEKVL